MASLRQKSRAAGLFAKFKQADDGGGGGKKGGGGGGGGAGAAGAPPAPARAGEQQQQQQEHAAAAATGDLGVLLASRARAVAAFARPDFDRDDFIAEYFR